MSVTPSSQKADARPISFVLEDRTQDAIFTAVDLFIRPEELTRSTPSRLTTQQVSGSAPWMDSFGAGISTITISGHTGWRRRELGGDGRDGIDRFQFLYENVFQGWHRLREDAIERGMNPEGVTLIFNDGLDNFSVVVAPTNFTLRRSRARPLLAQYQIAMTVLSETSGYQFPPAPALPTDAVAQLLGLESLIASINQITAFANRVQDWVGRELVAPLRRILDKVTRLYRAVSDAISASDSAIRSLAAVARTLSQIIGTVFATLAAAANIPSVVKQALMDVAGEFRNVLCLLNNSLRGLDSYEDYTPLYGASNCSSTSGGRPPSPLVGVNPFYLVANDTQQFAQISTAATDSGNAILRSDPALAPLTPEELLTHLSAVANGVEVAA